MADPRTFSNLRNILAQLYPDEASTRRVAYDAGLSATRISFSAIAINTWHTILSEAENVNKVNALLAVVLEEYGDNPALHEACAAYHRAAQPKDAIPNDFRIQPDFNRGSPPYSGSRKTPTKRWLWGIPVLLLIVGGLSYGAKYINDTLSLATTKLPEATPATAQVVSASETAIPTLASTSSPIIKLTNTPAPTTTLTRIITVIPITSSTPTPIIASLNWPTLATSTPTPIIASLNWPTLATSPALTPTSDSNVAGAITVTVEPQPITAAHLATSTLVFTTLSPSGVISVVTVYLSKDVTSRLVATDTATSTQPMQMTTPQAGATRINPKDGAVYVYIRAGEFLMGSTDGDELAFDWEKPQHKVFVNDFWITQTEVTNAQYKRCVDADVCTKPDNDRWYDTAYAEHPVTDVIWNQARLYAEWAGGRLPTEAEWEKACRGTDGNLYPWGNGKPSPELLNFQNGGLKDTTVVGSYPSGAYGLHDMAGNVWEWTSSLYKDYPYDPNDGRENTAATRDRVLRGGAFSEIANFVRCTFRASYGRDNRGYFIGFRVVSSGS